MEIKQWVIDLCEYYKFSMGCKDDALKGYSVYKTTENSWIFEKEGIMEKVWVN